MHDELVLHAAHFAAPGERTAAASAVPPAPASGLLQRLPDQVAALERAAIAAALRATGGNRLAAAKMLRMSRAALYDRLARYPELDISK